MSVSHIQPPSPSTGKIVPIKGLPEVLTTSNGKVALIGKVIVDLTFSGIEMPRATLAKLWIDAGLDPQYLPKNIRTRTTVLRTMREMELAGFTRRIVETADEAIWVLVDEHIDAAAQDVEFEKTNRMVYDKKAKTLTVSNTHFQPVVDQLMERFADLFQTADVRNSVLDAVKGAGCVTLRRHGGCYFVPAARFDMLQSLQAFCHSLAGAGAMTVLNVPATGDDGLQVFKNFEEEFMGDLEKLADKLAELEGIVFDGKDATVAIAGSSVELLGARRGDFTSRGIRPTDVLTVVVGGATLEFTVLDVVDATHLVVNDTPVRLEGAFTIERQVDTKTRASTWATQTRAYNEQRQKVAMFAELLDFEAKQYVAMLDVLDARVQKNATGG